MINKFGFMSGYRFLLAVITALILLTSSYAIGEQAQFKHELLTLTLPDGWSVNKDVVPGKIIIGALQSPMAVMRARKSYIMMIGYVPDVSGAKMEEDFIKILKSAE